jgi:hypothetical protein
VYAPETVARAILHAATHPERDVYVGAGGKLLSVMEKVAPRLTDLYMEKKLFGMQRSDRPARPREEHALYAAGNGGRGGTLNERGDYDGHVSETSLYTSAVLHPWVSTAIVMGIGIAVAVIAGSAMSKRHTEWTIR